MATFVNAPTRTTGYPRSTGRSVPLGGVTTYYYRTTAGTRASTTSLANIPAGAVVERIVTQ